MASSAQQLLDQLDHPDDEISSWAAGRLARLGERRAIEPLLAMLDVCLTANARDPAATARNRRCWGVASALAAFHEPRAFDGLVRLFRESRGITQEFGARALGSFGDARALPTLWEVLATQPGQAVVSLGGGLRHAILQALAQLHDPAVIPLLIEEFAHPDQYNVARQAARLVALVGEASLPAVIEAQTHSDPHVRNWATVAMEHLADPRLFKPLVGGLVDDSPMVRWQAARVLGELGDARAIAHLKLLTDDPDDEVRKVVASSLRKLGAREGPQLPEPGPNRQVLKVYADYSQFYLGDAGFDGDTASPEFWSAEAFARKLAVAPPGLIGIGTARYDFVPVVIEVLGEPPTDEPKDWDHVVEASLELPSGQLAIDGCTSDRPDTSPHIQLTPGTYRLRVFCAGQNTFDEDWYHVVLWPQSPYEPPRVLKQL